MADYQPGTPKLQEQDLQGKVAIVTGATKGIGRAIALDLSTRGCSILGTYSSPQSAHNFDTLSHTVGDLYQDPYSSRASSVTPGSNAPTFKGVVADITSLPSVGTVLRDFGGKIDILVLNAAVNVRPRVGEASEADVARSLMRNVQWPVVLVENLVRQRCFNANSRVVAISSDRVRDPSPGSTLFTSTKSALESLTRCWSLELPLLFPGTTSNAISVGLTDTPGLRSYPPAAVSALKAARLAKVKVAEGGRLGYAEDVADVVGWLVGEKSRWVTGSVVAANGGAEYVGGAS
ncbi:NAD(P)-binding protein [Lophiostoma macrostomum CBS 122681]|uniref:NAD(P)-binding protein n=1 Tax=Lophiostoma macrostomum CBS 122681 TaxID=1314788 RepID=A0A6A6THE9_9PLEO|nr:NAD(P)-binding protein [Lophiostoma macrostomum CBS 122681]